MDIKLYILITFIIYIVQSTPIQNNPITDPYHITDYILTFNTYHFEWNNNYFTSKILANKNIQACSKNMPLLCIQYTPQAYGFTVHYNNTNSFNFINDNDWTHINYIHSNDSITLYGPTHDNNHIYYEAQDHDMDDMADDITPFQSPNPNVNARRLLRRAKCRVYLYKNQKFSGRKGGTFRRRRYKRRDLRKRGFRRGGVKSVKVRGSKCCTAKLYKHDNFRGQRTRFRYGRYSRIRKKKHQVRQLGSLKVYCSSRGRKRGGKRRSRRRRSRRRRCPCKSCPCGGGGGGSGGAASMNNGKPIPILLGPMTGMLGHFGYSMHPIMPPQIAHMAGMHGNFGSGQGMAMMNHPAYGGPQMGSSYGMPPGQMMGMGNGMGGMMAGGMGGMGGMMGGMGGMGMHPGMMGGMGGMMGGMGMRPGMMGGMRPGMGGMMGGMGGMGGQPGGKTPVVHVYTDGDDGGGGGEEETYESAEQRRRLQVLSDGGYDGAAIRKCVLMDVDSAEICATFYFGGGMLTLDYTVAGKKYIRVDEDEDEEDIHESDDDLNDEGIIIEFEESDSEEEEIEGELIEFDDDDIGIEHEDYEIMRHEKLFGFKSEEEIVHQYENGMIDYVNSVVWMWTKQKHKQNKCNENMLSFMNMSICTMHVLDNNSMNDIVIYNKYNGIDDKFDINEMKFNVRNQMDWDEIYSIHMLKGSNTKLCSIESMIKICAEIAAEAYAKGDINEMQISIEFL